ncbi:hypothetical protein ACFLTJ_00505 [Chloroflexota bacterium]
MKKSYFIKIGVVALAIVSALIATGGRALAWGPVAHQQIVAGARETVSAEIQGLWEAYPRYMYGGAIAPDWCLAYATLKPDAADASEVASHQDEFHSPEFLQAMKDRAVTDSEKAF